MEKYFLKTNTTDTYAIIKKYINLDENDFSYTESGNDITLTSYIGSDDDVIVLDRHMDIFTLARPSQNYTLTLNPTPNDATVVLTAPGYTQSGNTITVEDGTVVNYSVSKEGYYTNSGKTRVINNSVILISLNLPSTYADVTNYNYSFNGTDVLLTKYTGSETDITIPGLQGN